MKRFLQFIITLAFGVLFLATPTTYAQEVPDEICIFDEQDSDQDELLICEEVTEVLEEEIPEEVVLKGEPSQETVAGTSEVFAPQEPAVLGATTAGSSPSVLAETGASTGVTILVGVTVVALVLKVNKSSVIRYKTKRN